jgi:YYY domain-containing protein
VTDGLRWLLATEALSLAGMPLVMWTFRSLPDRGAAFSKLLALILITWIIWWASSVAGVGTSAALPWLLLALVGAAGWISYGKASLAAVRANLGVLVAEEALFVAGFVLWAVVRSLHPDIVGTEKPMDLMLLQTTTHAAMYPPQDLWLAGHTVNYYYFGYLFLSVLGRMAGTSVLVSYNLSLALIFGLALAGAYSISYNLIRHKVWGLFGPLFVVLLGNAHAFFFQVLEGRFPWNSSGWYWESTRIVGETAPGVATTINEFPLFSLILGDLHPHVIAIPVVLLAITFALLIHRDSVRGSIFKVHENRSRGTWENMICIHPGRLVLAGIAIGSLFAINPWDFPTYLTLAVGAIALAAVQARFGSQASESRRANLHRAGRSAALLVALAVAAFLPFYLSYQSPTHGVGLVTAATDPGQLAQISGSFGFLVVAFLLFHAWQQGALIPTRDWRERVIRGRGSRAADRTKNVALSAAVLAALAVAAISHRWVLLAGLAVAVAGLYLLFRQSSSGAIPVPQHHEGEGIPRRDLSNAGDDVTPGLVSASVASGTHPPGTTSASLDPSRGRTPGLPSAGDNPVGAVTSGPHSASDDPGRGMPHGPAPASVDPDMGKNPGIPQERADPATGNASATADHFVVLLIALSALLLVATEVVYLRDSFDGGAFYRINTVFKFYYQIWILLGLAAAYAVARPGRALRRRLAAFALWMGCVAAIVGIGGLYTFLGPLSYYGDLGGGPVVLQLHPLSGLESIATDDPRDYQAITWIRRHITGSPVILEATGGEYTTFARVSTYTGLPTLLGWQGHEAQWRGNVAILSQRHALIDEIYSTGSASLARRLLRSNHVSFVYVGPCERQVYAGGLPVCGQTTPVPSARNALTKFRAFMKLRYDSNGVQIYEMPRS